MRKILWAVLGFGLFIGFGQVSAQTITLNMVPSSQSAAIGSPVTVAIKISGLGNGAAPSLGVFDLDVHFDGGILALTKVTFGDPVLGDQLDVLGLGSLALSTPGVGSVNLLEVSFDLPQDLDALQEGTFILATLAFDTLDDGISLLTITVNALGDALGDALPANVGSGSVAVGAGAVDLAPLLGNSGFEVDLAHSQWTATKPNKTYQLGAPAVNPTIVPKGKISPLEAAVGNHFIGILNTQDSDISGKLVHTAVQGSFTPGTTFAVSVFANRGRLAGANTPVFDSAPSEVQVTFFGWGAGSVPTINPNSDNWSRGPSVKLLQAFSNWAPNGAWASQTFEFPTDKDLQYLSLSIAGLNHKKASYVAFDIE